MNPVLRWFATVAAVAALVHLGSTWYLPRLLMSRAMDGLAAQAGGHNRLFHAPLATAGSRTIVRPSTDMLYSLCVIDLSRGL